ncbi:MAG: hypothetical protein EZS28_030393 [Streblomastix strix]|uniref:Uncharacterized protein n=1 Tax=Streblomastix strix TaxID=222440 RepID=A0A5J4UV82_9EUKA|nr:MAG: hypothetical protein EZS28_030393 [Streblomastix strix]
MDIVADFKNPSVGVSFKDRPLISRWYVDQQLFFLAHPVPWQGISDRIYEFEPTDREQQFFLIWDATYSSCLKECTSRYLEDLLCLKKTEINRKELNRHKEKREIANRSQIHLHQESND